MKVPRWYDPIPSARKTKKKASSRSRWIVAILIFVVLPVVVTVVQLVRPYQSTETPVPGINTFVSVGDVDFLFRRLEFCKACGPESGVTLDADYTGKISKLLAVYKNNPDAFFITDGNNKRYHWGVRFCCRFQSALYLREPRRCWSLHCVQHH